MELLFQYQRYLDMIPGFGRRAPEICIINNTLIALSMINGLSSLKQIKHGFPQIAFQFFANVIYAKGAPLNNCWVFIDGTVRPCCMLDINQRIVYDWHKRVHGIEFQSVLTKWSLLIHLVQLRAKNLTVE